MRAVVASLALHVALLAALLQCHPARPTPAPAKVIEIATAAPPSVAPVPVTAETTTTAPRPTSAKRPRRAPERAVIAAEPLGSGGGSSSGSGTGRGSGSGSGSGNGSGINDASRHGIAIAGGLENHDPPPPPSRARPAKLLYPARNRPERDGHVFVALLTVDHDGIVVGVHRVDGAPGKLRDDAASLVWRFRYAPALDDDGRPIRSEVEQRFQVD